MEDSSGEIEIQIRILYAQTNLKGDGRCVWRNIVRLALYLRLHKLVSLPGKCMYDGTYSRCVFGAIQTGIPTLEFMWSMLVQRE